MENIVAFVRKPQDDTNEVICVGNFSALSRKGYRLGLPRAGKYRLIMNTDDQVYGGKGKRVPESFESQVVSAVGRENSVAIDLPPLSTLWFELEQS